MRIDRMKKRTAGQTVCSVSTRGAVICHWPSIATDRVLRLIAKGRIEDAELCVIKNVEGFRAELHIQPFANGKALLQGRVEIPSLRVIE